MKRHLLAFSLLVLCLFPLIAQADVTLPNPLGKDFNNADLITVVVRSLRLVLGAVDIFALFMFILGGFELLMSGGNPTLVKKGRDTLLWATIGVVAITLSYTVLKFIFDSLNSVST